MPRPSMKDERRSQILDAFEICLARYGVEGATLEKVAEEAGLARPLIRHNVGNREDLLKAVVARFVEQSDDSMDALISALPPQNRVRKLIDWLFDPSMSDSQAVLVSEALIAAGAVNPWLARIMRKWTRDFISSIADVIKAEYPETDDETVQSVAAGISGTYFTVESLGPIGPMTDIRTASKAAALRLAQSLET